MHQHVLAPSIEEEAFHNSLEIVKEFPKDPVLLPVELDKWDTESEKEVHVFVIIFVLGHGSGCRKLTLECSCSSASSASVLSVLIWMISY